MKSSYFKIVFLLIIFSACAAFFAILNLRVSNDLEVKKNNYLNSSKTLIESDAIEISEIPLGEITEDEYGRLFYTDNQIKRKVVQNNNDLSRLQFSPLKDKYGFIENSDNSEAVPYDRQVLIFAGDADSRQTKEVYHGSFKTSGWEWFSNEEILISVGCGTECQFLYLIDLASGKRSELNYGVNYKWSPDKTRALAFHYTVRPGFTVGDKLGNELFTLRIQAWDDSRLFGLLQAEWSGDSEKIALVIKKENEEKMGLLVFDVQNDFKKIFQNDIEILDNIKLSWDNNKVLINDREYIIE